MLFTHYSCSPTTYRMNNLNARLLFLVLKNKPETRKRWDCFLPSLQLDLPTWGGCSLILFILCVFILCVPFIFVSGEVENHWRVGKSRHNSCFCSRAMQSVIFHTTSFSCCTFNSERSYYPQNQVQRSLHWKVTSGVIQKTRTQSSIENKNAFISRTISLDLTSDVSEACLATNLKLDNSSLPLVIDYSACIENVSNVGIRQCLKCSSALWTIQCSVVCQCQQLHKKTRKCCESPVREGWKVRLKKAGSLKKTQ